MLGHPAPVFEWWRERRLRIRDLPRPVQAMVWGSFAIVGVSAVLIIAIGAGWEPWGGTQFAAFGGIPPRLTIPWACVALGVLAAAVTLSTTIPGWRHPVLVRVAVGLGGAALAAQGTSMGWVVDAGGAHSGAAVVLGWIGLGIAASVAFMPQRSAERHQVVVVAAGAAPFLLTLVVWSTIGGATVVLPDGLAVVARDVYAQATITFIGAVAAAAGILLLWSLVLSARQARDIGEGMADLQANLPVLLGVLLGAKAIWLAVAYSGSGLAETVASSTADGWSAWVVGGFLVAGAAWWLTGRGPAPPTDYEHRESLRLIGVGYAAGPIAAVVVGLLAGIAGVLWTLQPSARLTDLLGWIIGSEPPVALWVVVGASALCLVAAVLRRRTGWVAAAVVGVWAAPRAVELTSRILEVAEPVDAPSRVTVDTIVTVVVMIAAVQLWRGRWIPVDTGVLMLVLVVSTLIAHPLGIMPAAWQDGGAFYVLLIYPLFYTFLFDSVWLNGLDDEIRPGRVLRAVSVTALLVVTTSLLVLLDRVGPGFETAEAALLGAIGEAYLLYPAALLAVAAAMRRRRTGEGGGSLGTQATRRWFWESASARISRKTTGDGS